MKETEFKAIEMANNSNSHPLSNRWTLRFFQLDPSKSLYDMQKDLAMFDSVEGFWSIFNITTPPSQIKVGCDYSLFKKGIPPLWEHAANVEGGRWIITLNKNSILDVDELWRDVLLCLIGESLDHPNEIRGAVVNIRSKFNRISIWTANSDNQKAILDIGHKLRESIELEGQSLHYILHTDMPKNVKSIYTL